MKFDKFVLTFYFVFVIIGVLFVTQKANATPPMEAYEQCEKIGQMTAFIIQLRDAGMKQEAVEDLLPEEVHVAVRAVYTKEDVDIQSFPSKVSVNCLKVQWGTT